MKKNPVSRNEDLAAALRRCKNRTYKDRKKEGKKYSCRNKGK